MAERRKPGERQDGPVPTREHMSELEHGGQERPADNAHHAIPEVSREASIEDNKAGEDD